VVPIEWTGKILPGQLCHLAYLPCWRLEKKQKNNMDPCFRALSQKKNDRRLCVVWELVPLGCLDVTQNSRCKTNRILVPLNGSFQNFRQAPRPFYVGVPPPWDIAISEFWDLQITKLWQSAELLELRIYCVGGRNNFNK